MSQASQKISGFRYLILIACATSIGGVLFGYDNGSISGTIGFLKEKFDLSPAQTGWLTSSLILGCILGVIIAGKLSDIIGRKKVLFIAASCFLLYSALACFANSLGMLTFARILGGLGVGMETTVVPLYLAEISPAKIRGRLVSMNQIFNVAGNLLVFSVSAYLAATHLHQWSVDYGWRWVYGLGFIPAAILFGLIFIIPESPRWLQKKGRGDEALAVLTKINGESSAKAIQQDIIAALKSEESSSIKSLFKPGLRIVLVVGVLLAAFQQITGIGAIMYYAPEIFKNAGAGVNAAMTNTVIIGAVNLIFTFIGLWIVDKVGRKSLLLVGSAIMTVCLVLVGTSFNMAEMNVTIVLVLILLYIAAFAISFGVVVWVMIAEIFPTHVRGVAISIATFALWGGNYLVSLLFPISLDSFGSTTTFMIFAVLSGLSFIFTWIFVPETKGKSLEEIEASWKMRKGA